MSKKVVKMLGREDILSASDIVTEDVEVSEWGGTVRVKGMTGTERNEFEASLIIGKGKNATMNMKNAMAKLVAAAIIDQDGNAIFKPADVEALGNKSAKALARVYKVASSLSGLTEEDMEELTKNSESDPNDTFTSN